jgi:hypothetical protein
MSGFKKNIAVLLMAYERPENTIQQMKKLASLDCRIYLFIDGPRNDDIRRKQGYMREEAKKISTSNFLTIKVNQEKENLGLVSAIPKGIDWIFTQEQTAAIFEDDIEFQEEFLIFSEETLAKYLHDDEILLVSGNQFMNMKDKNGISATSYPLIWGWSTTARKWDIMKILSEKEDLERKVFLKPTVAAYWKLGWMRARDKRINSWIIGIAAQMRFTGKYCISPNVNLTSNVGDDSVAVHTTDSSPGMRVPLQTTSWISDMDLHIDLNTEAYDCFLEKNLYEIKLRNLLTLFLYRATRMFQRKKETC